MQEDLEGTRAGSVLKEFRGGRGTVRLVLDGAGVTDPARADELLAELTGIPSEKFFRSTASVRHHEVDDLARDEGALRDRLQASISGADRGTSSVKRRLDRALREPQREGREEPRPAPRRGEGGHARRGGRRRRRGPARRARARPRRPGGRPRASRRGRDLARRAALAAGEGPPGGTPHRRARRRPGALRALPPGGHRLRTRSRRSSRATPPEHALPVLRQVVERLRVLDREIAELGAQLGDGASAVDYEIVIPEPRWRTFAIAAAVLAVAGLAAALVGFVSSQFSALVGGPGGGRRGSRPGGLCAHEASRGVRLPAPPAAARRRDRATPPRPQPARGGPEAAHRGPRHPAGIAPAGRPSPPPRTCWPARTRTSRRSTARGRSSRGSSGRLPRRRSRPCATPRRSRSSRRPAPWKPSGRSPRSPGPASGSRWRSATRRPPWNAPATTRPTPARGSSRTRWTPSRSPCEVERLADWREELAAIQRRIRVYQLALDAIVRAERSTMRTATRYLEKRMRGDLERLTGGALPARPRGRRHARHPRLRPGARRLGPRRGAVPGDARPGLPGRAPRSRPPRHAGLPAAARLRRPVRHVRR